MSLATLQLMFVLSALAVGLLGGGVSLVLSMIPELPTRRDRIAYQLSRGMVLFFGTSLTLMLLNIWLKS